MALLRLARESDAEALAAIYAPFVEHTAVSFETEPPGRVEMARRIVETIDVYPWLVCELDGTIAGYAYATRHRVRSAYRWSVDTSAYVDAAYQRRGIGRGLYSSLFEILRAQGFFNAYAGNWSCGRMLRLRTSRLPSPRTWRGQTGSVSRGAAKP